MSESEKNEPKKNESENTEAEAKETEKLDAAKSRRLTQKSGKTPRRKAANTPTIPMLKPAAASSPTVTV